MKRARFAQLSAVALALVLVFAAGGYGITRGFRSSGTSTCVISNGFNILQYEVPQGESRKTFRTGGYEWPPLTPHAVPKTWGQLQYCP